MEKKRKKRIPKFKIKTKHILIFLIVISFIASYFFPGVGANETIQNSITFIGLLFGIIGGFFITDLYTRYQGIRSNAAVDSSCLTTFYGFAKILGKKNKKWLQKQRNLINDYIHKFMPLPWEKYGQTEPEFSAIVDSLGEIKYGVNDVKENETYSNILAVVSTHSDARERLVMYGKDKLSWAEWLVIFILAILLIGSLFYVKDTTTVSIIFTGSLCSAILILLFFIRDLNNLNFGEQAVSISPYERVLDAIGKPRYYRKKGDII